MWMKQTKKTKNMSVNCEVKIALNCTCKRKSKQAHIERPVKYAFKKTKALNSFNDDNW